MAKLIYKEKKPVEVPKGWSHKLKIRSKSYQLLKKNLIVKKACVYCYEKKVIMTHIDYDSPYHVIWLCKKHYLAFQKERKEYKND